MWPGPPLFRPADPLTMATTTTAACAATTAAAHLTATHLTSPQHIHTAQTPRTISPAHIVVQIGQLHQRARFARLARPTQLVQLAARSAQHSDTSTQSAQLAQSACLLRFVHVLTLLGGRASLLKAINRDQSLYSSGLYKLRSDPATAARHAHCNHYNNHNHYPLKS